MSDQPEQWLDRVYGAGSPAEIESLYDQWADHYDRHLVGFGYTNYLYALGLMGRHVPADAGEILDAGCGTGALGEHLAVLGYDSLVGVDLSRRMLAVARGRGCYRELLVMDLGGRLEFRDDRFAACVSLGVLTAAHAPPSALDEMVRITRPGGRLVFTLTDPALDEWGFRDRLDALDASGRWRRLEVTPPYHPMPHSESEGDLVSRLFVYEVA